MIDRIFKTIVGAFCFFWILKNILMPTFGLAWYYSDYSKLSSSCANAMDEGWFADQLNNPKISQSTDVELLICHNYDKTRKAMLSLGITEPMLSYIELRAMEIHQQSIEDLVSSHRFKER